jgi:hypothetical protein
MALTPITPAGKFGIISDIPAFDLPLEAWSSGQNVRVRDGAIERIFGIANKLLPLSGNPIGLFYARSNTENFFVYPTLTKIYAVATGVASHFDATRTVGGDYTATTDVGWNGGMFNGVLILNNSFDKPQAWTPVVGGAAVDLPNWPATWKAAVIRPYRAFLLALDLTEGATQDATAIAWGHPASPGTVPNSWDYTLTTVDAGKVSLAETPGALVDCMPLGRINIVYKSDAVYAQQYVAGQDIFRFDRIQGLGNLGLYARNCMTNIPGAQFCVTQNDMGYHAATDFKSILSARQRKRFFGDSSIVEQSAKHRSFCIAYEKWNEVWFCFASAGSTWPNRALVWNYNEDKLSERDLLSETPMGVLGVPPSEATIATWDALPYATWADWPDITWDVTTLGTAAADAFFARNFSTPALYLADTTNQFNSVDFVSTIERTGLAFNGHDGRAQVNRIIPRMQGTGTVNIFVGSQELRDGPVTYFGPFPYTIGTDTEVQPLVEGRYHAIKYTSTSAAWWKLDGQDIEVVSTGRY